MQCYLPLLCIWWNDAHVILFLNAQKNSFYGWENVFSCRIYPSVNMYFLCQILRDFFRFFFFWKTVLYIGRAIYLKAINSTLEPGFLYDMLKMKVCICCKMLSNRMQILKSAFKYQKLRMSYLLLEEIIGKLLK